MIKVHLRFNSGEQFAHCIGVMECRSESFLALFASHFPYAKGPSMYNVLIVCSLRNCHSNATYQYRLPLGQPSTSPSIQTSFMDVPLHHTMPHVFALLSPSTRTFTPNDPTKRRVSELSTMRTNIGSTFIRHGERERRVDGWLVTELDPNNGTGFAKRHSNGKHFILPLFWISNAA